MENQNIGDIKNEETRFLFNSGTGEAQQDTENQADDFIINQKQEDLDRYDEDQDEQEYMDEGEEEEIDPYMNMSIDELKERLPAYMFKTDEEKVLYFQELNKNYYHDLQEIKEVDLKETSRNVNFSKIFQIRSKSFRPA